MKLTKKEVAILGGQANAKNFNKDEKIKIKYCNNEVELTIKELADMMAENL